MTPDSVRQAKEVLKDMVISVRNHKRGTDYDTEYKHYQAREEALTTALQIIDEWLKLKEENLRLRAALENIAVTDMSTRNETQRQFLDKANRIVDIAKQALAGEKEII